MKKLLSMAAAALLLAGCSSDENINDNSIAGQNINVTASVDDMGTRAGHDALNLPQTFRLTIDQEGTYYDYTNILMSRQGETNKYASEQPMMWAGPADITATAATFSLDGVQALAVRTNQSAADGTALKESDHLYMAPTAITPSVAGISVDLSHIMSKVVLNINFTEEFTDQTNPVEALIFNGTLPSRNFDRTQESALQWTDIDTISTTGIAPLFNAYTAPTETAPNAVANYEVILVPQTATAFGVAFSIDGRDYKWTSSKAVTLASGYDYTLNLSVGKDKVTDVSLNINDWNDGGEIEGGMAE